MILLPQGWWWDKRHVIVKYEFDELTVFKKKKKNPHWTLLTIQQIRTATYLLFLNLFITFISLDLYGR